MPTKAHYRIIYDNNKRYGNRGGSHCLFCAGIEGSEQTESHADDFFVMELEFRERLFALFGIRSINIESRFGYYPVNMSVQLKCDCLCSPSLRYNNTK